ncbi:MAG: hypothetical protein U0936_17975 [Planctomycetaceae bacterium]
MVRTDWVVGMATSIPPHNMAEVCEAVIRGYLTIQTCRSTNYSTRCQTDFLTGNICGTQTPGVYFRTVNADTADREHTSRRKGNLTSLLSQKFHTRKLS